MRLIVLSAVFFVVRMTCFAQNFTEILGRPTNNSITLNVMFDAAVSVYLEYGTIKGTYSNSTTVTSVVASVPVEIKITGLLPDSRYYYRVHYKKATDQSYLPGQERTFMTQRAKGKSFTFTIEADPHPYDPKGYHPLWDICLQNQLSDGADFMFDLGDTFGDDHVDKVTNLTRTSAQVKQLMLDNRPHFGGVCHSMPFFFCQGNHEGENGYYLLQTPPENLATYETVWRKYYYPNPEPDGFYTGNNDVELYGMGKPQNYYAFEWGDALFVVVDGWRYYTSSVKPRNWEWTIGKAQYDWLKQTLENSTAKYKFVFTHHVMGETRGGVAVATGFEWGGLDNGKDKFAENRPGWELPIHQLMVKNKVNVLFQGHDHVYAYEKLDNLVYQTVQMPSDSSYTLGYDANGSAFTGTVLKGAGHIRVCVNPDSVKVDFVNAMMPYDETPTAKNGQVLFSYSVKSSASSSNVNTPSGNELLVKIFPNPATDQISVTANNAVIKSIQIVSIDGKAIVNNIVNTNQGFIHLIDTSGRRLNPGVYLVLVTTENNSVLRKMLIVQ